VDDKDEEMQNGERLKRKGCPSDPLLEENGKHWKKEKIKKG
jgi:hypothetical protein